MEINKNNLYQVIKDAKETLLRMSIDLETLNPVITPDLLDKVEDDIVKGYKKPNAMAINVIKDFEGFTISYNPMANETALIPHDKELWFILTGDFRQVYENLNLKQALQKFIKLSKKHINGWSNAKDEAEKLLSEIIND